MIAWEIHERGITKEELHTHFDKELNTIPTPLKNQIYNAMQDIDKGLDKTPAPIRLRRI